MVKVKRGTIKTFVKQEGGINYMTLPGMGSTALSPELLTKLKAIENSILVATITSFICESTKVKFKDVQTKSRKRELVLARHFCMYYLTLYTRMTLDTIGEVLNPNNPLNHSTVSHGRDTMKEYLDPSNKSPYAESVREIDNKINLKIIQLCKSLP